AKGVNVGASLCEHDLAETASEILAKAEKVGCDVMLPSHVVLAKEFKAGAANRTAHVDDVQADEMILDVAPESVTLLKERLATVKTLIWNGPFGAFEIDPFGDGTIAVAKEAEKLTKSGALISVAGGGDTVSALAKAGVTEGLTYISTAGGAFLEWMEGNTLPEVKKMDDMDLEDIAKALVAPSKGILAADESTGTIKKRLDTINTPSTEETRRDYRELLLSSKGAGDYISGVILYDETLRQQSKNGGPLTDLIKKQGIIPGIKVDTGAKPLAFSEGELVTEGLDGLRDRLNEYHKLGARFAKWRAVISIGDAAPSQYCIDTNAHALARYAALCQEAGIVPIVEPEVMMDGDHNIDECYAVTETTLKTVFDELYKQRVVLEQ
ncbi:unnamed protein product, partial [Discosporangium mesarthrocarpum]